MKDFIRIFVGISVLAAAFLFGSNYGEKVNHESEEYKSFAKSKEELSFAKSRFENIKTKLQNITDQSTNKKTEELLAQILEVFESDLDMKIQSKETILKEARQLRGQTPSKEMSAQEPKHSIKNKATASSQAGPKININKFKSFEWMVQNSSGGQETARELKKVQIKNLNSFLAKAEFLDKSECARFLGAYKGRVKDINDKYFGSFEFELKDGKVNTKKELSGKLAWYSETNKNTFSEQIDNNCGKKIKGLSGRIFNISADKYVQIYKLNNLEKIASNFYEVLPNGTSKILGSIILNRVDKF